MILSKEGGHISAIQNHYSLLYRSSEDTGILDFCKENDITFFSYMVLEQGALSGKYDKDHLMPEGSMRGNTYNPIFPKIEKLLEGMHQIADKHHATPAQVAMAWAISKGTTPIIGRTRKEQVEDAVQAMNLKLDEKDIHLLEKLAEESGVDTRGSWERPMA